MRPAETGNKAAAESIKKATNREEQEDATGQETAAGVTHEAAAMRPEKTAAQGLQQQNFIRSSINGD
jgi:hypothetical protein